MPILQDLTQANELIATQLAEIQRLKAKAVSGTKPIRCKVSEKGALSIYGLNARFPVTLYLSQWTRLMDALPEIQAFVKANQDSFAVKGD